MKKYYITTAIDYPNGTPHMGHAYEKIITDFYARHNRLIGNDVHFVTGTDENGQKLKITAAENNLSTKEFVDKNVLVFKKLCIDLNISNNDFIRTTEKRHHNTVHKIWNKVKGNGHIVKGDYTGPYCIDCECFYTDAQLEEGKCPNHHKELPIKKEEGYFFKLSEFKDWLIEYITTNDDFITPASARKEILSRLKSDDLRDLSISRPNEGWGVTVPDDENFVIYTWFDALINYYAALSDDQKGYWPASTHVIGRDIIWFHCVIWPAILKSCEMEIPHQIYVHGMILADDGRKMSKSLGNGVDPNDIISKYSIDSFRFYLLKSIPSLADGRFSEKDLIETHNNILANDFGNLIMRVLKLAIKRVGNEVTCHGDFRVSFDSKALLDQYNGMIEKYEHNKAIDYLWSEIQKINQYVNEKEPWKYKESCDELINIIFNCCYALQVFSYLLYPIMPNVAKQVMEDIGADINQNPFNLEVSDIKYTLSMPEALFPKIDIE